MHQKTENVQGLRIQKIYPRLHTLTLSTLELFMDRSLAEQLENAVWFRTAGSEGQSGNSRIESGVDSSNELLQQLWYPCVIARPTWRRPAAFCL